SSSGLLLPSAQAQDRGGDFPAILAHDEVPRRFPFRTLRGDLPEAADIRNARGTRARWHRRGAVGAEGIPARVAAVTAFQPALGDFGLQAGGVLIEVEA